VSTTADYLATGFDIDILKRKHVPSGSENVEYAKGKILLDRSDCKTCHATDRQVNGPAFMAIADRYRNNPAAVRQLTRKIIHGGGGNWGTTVMTPHTQLSESDASEMVRWILGLGAAPQPKQTLPVSGRYALAPKSKTPGTYVLKATYRDKGAKGQAPLEGMAMIALRPALQEAEQADSSSASISVYHPYDNETTVLNNLIHNKFFAFKQVDLTGLSAISIRAGTSDLFNQYAGGSIELRKDTPGGTLLGQVEIPATNATGKMIFFERTLSLTPAEADGRLHDVYFVFKNETEPMRPVVAVDWVRFEIRMPLH
jgi:cytochrome c